MLRPEASEWDWKPEYILGQYQGALSSAWARGDKETYSALYNAFVCNWNRVVLRNYKGNRL
jgi:hypothetical protein